MANNTGLIIGVSVVGVAAIGVTIYLLSKKSSTSTTTPTVPLSSGGYAPSQRPTTNPPIGYYTNPAPAGQDSWWQQPLGQVGGNLANRLIDSLFKPKGSGATSSTGDDYSAYSDRGDTDPNFYGGYGTV
jgi:hypothetical protein